MAMTRRGFLGSLLALPAAGALLPTKSAPAAWKDGAWLEIGAAGTTRIRHITIYDANSGTVVAQWTPPQTLTLVEGDTLSVQFDRSGVFSLS